MPKSSTLTQPGARDEQVLRLDVAVHDVLRVRRRQHVEQLLGDGAAPRAAASALPAALPARLERLALEQLHHDERRPVGRDVVVEHAHRAVVLDGVGRVALLQEAPLHLLVVAQLRVQHLHRDALAVAVRRRVDRRHPADAEQRVELPLVLQHHARARARARAVCGSSDGSRSRHLVRPAAPRALLGARSSGSARLSFASSRASAPCAPASSVAAARSSRLRLRELGLGLGDAPVHLREARLLRVLLGREHLVARAQHVLGARSSSSAAA